ncbi:MAG: hypothetical protein R2825_10765 [Saprospiraceae bacterium]
MARSLIQLHNLYKSNYETQFEVISPDTNSSFRLLLNPGSTTCSITFSPEYELVFIEGANLRPGTLATIFPI